MIIQFCIVLPTFPNVFHSASRAFCGAHAETQGNARFLGAPVLAGDAGFFQILDAAKSTVLPRISHLFRGFRPVPRGATQEHKEIQGNARKCKVLQGFGGPGNLQIFAATEYCVLLRILHVFLDPVQPFVAITQEHC